MTWYERAHTTLSFTRGSGSGRAFTWKHENLVLAQINTHVLLSLNNIGYGVITNPQNMKSKQIKRKKSPMAHQTRARASENDTRARKTVSTPARTWIINQIDVRTCNSYVRVYTCTVRL